MKLPFKEQLTSRLPLLTMFPHALIRLLRQENKPPGVASASELTAWMSSDKIHLEISLINRSLSERFPVEYYLIKKIIKRGSDRTGLSETFVVPLDPGRYSEQIALIDTYLHSQPTE